MKNQVIPKKPKVIPNDKIIINKFIKELSHIKISLFPKLYKKDNIITVPEFEEYLKKSLSKNEWKNYIKNIVDKAYRVSRTIIPSKEITYSECLKLLEFINLFCRECVMNFENIPDLNKKVSKKE